MSRRRAPTALRRPISRVRSVTLTSITFMMPIPPTRSEMPTIPESTAVATRLMLLNASRISSWVRI